VSVIFLDFQFSVITQTFHQATEKII